MVVEGRWLAGENRGGGANGDSCASGGHALSGYGFQKLRKSDFFCFPQILETGKGFSKKLKIETGLLQTPFLTWILCFWKKKKKKNQKLEAMPSKAFACTGIVCDKGFYSDFFFSANTSRNYMTKVQGDYGFVILVHLGTYLRTWSFLVHRSWMSLDV